MTPTETMAALERAGTAQNVKIYKRHGAAEPLFGVSYANLDKLHRAIGVDHELALALWETGNHDARILATKIADPDRLGRRDLDSWVRDQIEAGINSAPNRTRHAMWITLIAIGGRTPGLRRKPEAAAKRIGTPSVDHGRTSCTTPDALPYIERMWERRLARQ